MAPNRRQSVRRALTWPGAVIAPDGAWRHKCKILDVSASGAQLAIHPSISLPGEFVLAFTESGQVSRPCLLVWRVDHRVGVRFTGERPSPPLTTR